ncbi:MAG: carbohydrate porin [Burkholderiaceae bacterium]
MKYITIISLLCVGLAASYHVQADEQNKPEETFSIHGQATIVSELHNGFAARYSGPNSLSNQREVKTSVTSTLFVGTRLWNGAELYYNPELAFGRGLSNVVGVAGFPNGEISRVGSANPTFYNARLFLRQTVGLGGEKEYIEADQNQLAGNQDVNRFVFTIGKLSVMDIFDANQYSHEPRSQFLNWSLMANGAWDFPADARGYTNGLAIEYYWPGWAARFGTFMMPAEANGLPLDSRLSQAHGSVVELEKSYRLYQQPGKLRVMAYQNHANMGGYADTINTPAAQMDITQTRKYRTKQGFGLNAEQQLSESVGGFLRAGWNDGKTETFAFTEIDRTISGGIVIKGSGWFRPDDVVGIAYAGNGLSKEHRDYLANGGLGFIVGDGKLNYAMEQILEAYYSIAVLKGAAFTFDFQHIRNPAYNRDRGPVNIFSARLHYEF